MTKTTMMMTTAATTYLLERRLKPLENLAGYVVKPFILTDHVLHTHLHNTARQSTIENEHKVLEHNGLFSLDLSLLM